MSVFIHFSPDPVCVMCKRLNPGYLQSSVFVHFSPDPVCVICKCLNSGSFNLLYSYISAPIPSVSCANALILASFNRTTYPDIEDKHLDVNNSPPNCNVRKRTTTTVAEIAIPFDECDTVKEVGTCSVACS